MESYLNSDEMRTQLIFKYGIKLGTTKGAQGAAKAAVKEAPK
jgi:hypothetical protein